MAVQIVAVNTATETSTPGAVEVSTSKELAQAGDVFIVCHRNQYGSAEYESNGTFPNSEFIVATPFEPGASGNGRTMGILYRVITDASEEPETYEIRTSVGTSRSQAVLMLVRGLDVSNPLITVSPTYAGDVTTAETSTPNMTISEPYFQVWHTAGEVTQGNSNVPLTTPADLTQQALLPETTHTDGSRTALWVGTAVNSAADTGQQASTWQWLVGGGAQTAFFRTLTPVIRLDTPVVSLGATTHPSAVGQSDGSQVVSWSPISGAASYTARLASGSDPTENDFVDVEHDVASPYVFTGLASGTYAFGIQARR